MDSHEETKTSVLTPSTSSPPVPSSSSSSSSSTIAGEIDGRVPQEPTAVRSSERTAAIVAETENKFPGFVDTVLALRARLPPLERERIIQSLDRYNGWSPSLPSREPLEEFSDDDP